jgi:hypothetical protein
MEEIRGKAMNKRCPMCKETKPHDQYSFSSYNKHKIQTYCKACNKIQENAARKRRNENPPTIIRSSKECQLCHNILPIGQFCRKTNSADGYHSYCKPCWNAYVKKAQKRVLDKSNKK